MLQNIEQSRILFPEEITAADVPTLARTWESLEAIEATTGIAVVRMPTSGGADRMQRVTCYPLGVAASSPDGKTARYDLYIATPGPGSKMLLERCGQLVATLGTEPAGLGGAANQFYAKSVTFTSTGRIKAATGGVADVQVFPESGTESPAGCVLIDTGDAVAWVIAPAKGLSSPVDSANALARNWT